MTSIKSSIAHDYCPLVFKEANPAALIFNGNEIVSVL